MEEIELEVTVEEANLILEALGDLPFVKVYALVAKLQNQARAQLGAPDAATPADGAELQTIGAPGAGRGDANGD